MVASADFIAGEQRLHHRSGLGMARERTYVAHEYKRFPSRRCGHVAGHICPHLVSRALRAGPPVIRPGQPRRARPPCRRQAMHDGSPASRPTRFKGHDFGTRTRTALRASRKRARHANGQSAAPSPPATRPHYQLTACGQGMPAAYDARLKKRYPPAAGLRCAVTTRAPRIDRPYPDGERPVAEPIS